LFTFISLIVSSSLSFLYGNFGVNKWSNDFSSSEVLLKELLLGGKMFIKLQLKFILFSSVFWFTIKILWLFELTFRGEKLLFFVPLCKLINLQKYSSNFFWESLLILYSK
jgi:hypothetical protein